MSSMFELNFENEKRNIPTRTENQKDDRFWKPDVKKTPDGRYMAQIRILPQGIEGIRDKKPVFVEQHTHMYRDEAHKVSLFAKCRKTLGRNEHCPICEASWAMYNTKQPAMQEKARHIRASITYIANVLIVDDDVHPENNGKVMLWRMTQKNYETLVAPLNDDPKSAENRFKKTQRFIPWSPIKGCNFNVIVTIGKNGFPDYSESCWDSNGLTDLATDDAGIEAILSNCYQLDEFLADIPSEEELARRYQEFCDTVSAREQSAVLGSVNGAVNMENVHMAGDPVGQHAEAPATAPEPVTNKFDMSDGASVAAFMQSQTKTVSSAPKAAPAAPQVQGTDGDDDELPF